MREKELNPVTGSGWHIEVPASHSRRLATNEEPATGRAPRSAIWAAFVGILTMTVLPNHQARAAEIWMTGGPGNNNDFLALFAPGAPWQNAAKKVRVFKLTTRFVLQGDQHDLAAVIAGIKAHGMALAVETGFLFSGEQCGRGMEGFAHRNSAALVAKRIKQAGGDLAYVAMDEPLWFGHHANGPTACHMEIPAIAAEVAEGVGQLRQVFPAVKVGDIEPTGQPVPDWLDDVQRWMAAYHAAVGTPLAFFHADIAWAHPEWQMQIKPVANLTRHAGMPFGVIVDSDQPESTDTGWTERAAEGLTRVRGVLGTLPDQLIYQSWQPHPTRYLPDDKPGTITNLVANSPG